jgi:hypothetical protein
MDNLWLVSAHVNITTRDGRGDAWQSTRQVPTFIIDGAIQGALDVESVQRIARSILMTAHLIGQAGDVDSIIVDVVRLEPEPPEPCGCALNDDARV